MKNKKVMTLFNYIGGKGWLRDQLRLSIEESLNKNKSLDTYVEPFAGGLGAFLNIYDLLKNNNIKNVILNDINKKLITFYQIVQNKPQDLVSKYLVLEKNFAKKIPQEVLVLHKTKDKDKLKVLLKEAENYYKEIRKEYNTLTDSLEIASRLLFLQNHCFNGVYRENSKGEYNTPFNWEGKIYTEQKIQDKVNTVHDIFKLFNITFSTESFLNLNYNIKTLYYLDPPYINEIEALENQYHQDSFNVEKQKLLIEKIQHSAFIYSNHDNSILLEEFTKHNIKIEVLKIARKNIISASNESRKNDKMEILISHHLES